MSMTPEQRIEKIKNDFKEGSPWWFMIEKADISYLLTALEESQQRIGKLELYIKSLEYSRDEAQKMAHNISKEQGLELFEAQQAIARQQEALEFLADDSNWSWWNVGTEDETVTWVGGTDPQHAAREALGNKEGSDKA